MENGELRIKNNLLLCLFFFYASVSAWNPTPKLIEEQATHTAFSQISVFQSAAQPEYSAYLIASMIYLPLPSQSALSTEWGIHDGFAIRQRFGMWLTNNFDGKDSKSLTYGVVWFGERHGWDNEDFLFFPNRGNFSQINQVHTFGLTVADSSRHLLFGSGLQYLNAENKTFRWWLLGTWSRFSVAPNFHKGDLQFINTQLNLQARELKGNADSWQNYLPDLEFSFFEKDSVKALISQNIFKQKFYLEGAFWLEPQDFVWAALKFYPDQSHLLLALEATATKKESGKVYFGGGITLPFLRIAYNHSEDYEEFFRSRGIWIVEFRLSMGTSGDSFFALKAPKEAPSEKNKVVKKTAVPPDFDIEQSKQ
jgi:hypothetical protein